MQDRSKYRNLSGEVYSYSIMADGNSMGIETPPMEDGNQNEEPEKMKIYEKCIFETVHNIICIYSFLTTPQQY